jgi:hypothetical protein
MNRQVLTDLDNIISEPLVHGALCGALPDCSRAALSGHLVNLIRLSSNSIRLIHSVLAIG